MNVLLATRLTGDANMVADALALRNVPEVSALVVVTDRSYKTQIAGAIYEYCDSPLNRFPGIRVLARVPRLIQWVRHYEIDILICHHLLSWGLAGLLTARCTGRPIVNHFLGEDLDVLCRHPRYGPWALRLARQMDWLTVQGSHSQAFLHEQGFSRVGIMPTVCIPENYLGAQRRRVYDLIYVGRMSREKRPDRFVEVVRDIRQRLPSVRAVMLGTGPLDGQIRQQIAQLSLSDHIECVGWSDDVAGYLRRSKIYLLTSDNDQLPLTLLEAMACGAVPISTPVGNVSDVILAGCGVVVDAASLAGSALDYLQHPARRRAESKQSVSRVQAFSVQRNTERWREILNKLMSGAAHEECISIE
jgi:glycosyltransferase involved in cell wall biosynthesis